jgi:signal transduction histidine kinase/HAMP domain-containing protein
VRLASRLFVASGAIVLLAIASLVIAADRVLRAGLEAEAAAGLEREARLVATLLPGDSAAWPDAARTLGALIQRRVTLIDPTGRVRGDTEFDRASLPGLENHAARPEVVAARRAGTGRDRRTSASTNAPQLYVALAAGPPGLAVVRVSAALDAVDAQVRAVQNAVLAAGLLALAAAALLAWVASRVLARPLEQIADAARAIAAGQPPVFPASHVAEVARTSHALRGMHEELADRFARLRREREETRTLVEALSDGIVAAGARGDVVSCNAAARRLLGFADGAPLPPLGELFHDKRARALLRGVLSGAEVVQEPLELEGRSLLVTGRALADGGTLLVLRDVTTLRRLETTRRDFVANASHELKTPLTSIAGYAETLRADAAPDSPVHRFADTILQNARRMQHLVDDLLDLSRIESGAWRPAVEVVELEPVVREAWAEVADQAGSAVTLTVTVPPDAHALAADPAALRQILVNLLDNALRHTPPGGRIGVAAERVADGVRLSVSDTGVGIPAEHLPRIFERFYRVDPARSRQRGGTGLGLAIVRHLVEAHGGRVEAESELGRGTTIRLAFPAG